MTNKSDQAQNPKKDFAAWLNRCLEQTDVSLTGIAAKAGMTPGYLSMLRRGERQNPSPEMVDAIAKALGVSPEDARKFACLPPPSRIRTRGWRIRARGGHRSDVSTDHPPVNWSCRMRTNQVTLGAEVRQIGDDAFEVLIKLTPSASPMCDAEIEEYHVHLLTDGREQAEVKASALMEGFTFTLGAGKHEFHCQRKGKDEELVLSVPIGQVIEPADTE